MFYIAVLLSEVYGDLDIDDHLGDPQEEQYEPGPNRPRPSGDDTPGGFPIIGQSHFDEVLIQL